MGVIWGWLIIVPSLAFIIDVRLYCSGWVASCTRPSMRSGVRVFSFSCARSSPRTLAGQRFITNPILGLEAKTYIFQTFGVDLSRCEDFVFRNRSLARNHAVTVQAWSGRA